MYKEKEFDFGKRGAFFAFSDSQLTEGITKHGGKKEDYVSMGGGLIAKKEVAKTLWDEFAEFNKKEMDKKLKHDGLESIIKYELVNHESYYIGDISPAMEILKDYGATEEQVMGIYKEELPKHDL